MGVKLADPRVNGAFPDRIQNTYMVGLERRVSAALSDVAAGAVTAAETAAALAALAAIVDGLTLNYGYASTVGSKNTTSITYVDISNTDFTITTTGGPLLIVMAGGSVTNDDFQEESIFGVSVAGVDYDLSDFYQDLAGDTDDIFVPVAGIYVVTGLAAGAHAVVGRFKTTSGGTARISGNSRLGLFAMELSL